MDTHLKINHSPTSITPHDRITQISHGVTKKLVLATLTYNPDRIILNHQGPLSKFKTRHQLNLQIILRIC
ncbi:hypothetical protein EPI10_005934 [Gossypium australe]|uniref:Uncharacterized protein n=1 Tax=Gossypium australe TaxID=47621 RepID=A0A5B6WRR3_9ROSI|nr:hypothetical protein EPI10_005934 [Gossypium australe]